MARPTKQGLDYFPLDVHIGLDDEVELIEAEFGLTGFAVIIKMYATIYRKHGFYMDFDSTAQLRFSNKVKLTKEQILKIVTKAVGYKLFDRHMLNSYQILTSAGIQRRFFEAIRRRRSVSLEKKYICEGVNVGDYPHLAGVFADNNPTSTDINDGKSTQSKGKERKGKEKKKDMFELESEPILIAKYFFDSLRKINPTHKEPNFQSWAKSIDLINRIDKRACGEIRWMISFALQHSFWHKNILSPDKLRKQWDRLALEAKEKHGGMGTTNGKYSEVG